MQAATGQPTGLSTRKKIVLTVLLAAICSVTIALIVGHMVVSQIKASGDSISTTASSDINGAKADCRRSFEAAKQDAINQLTQNVDRKFDAAERGFFGETTTTSVPKKKAKSAGVLAQAGTR